ncbi:MAG: hypothetical protein U0270_46535 [Labilithrix sp.]
MAKLLDDGPHAALMARAANLRGEDPDVLARRMVETSRVASGTRTVPRDEGSNSTASAGHDPGGEVVAKSVVNIEQSSLVGLLGVLGDIVVDAGERWRWSRAS